MAKFNPNKIKAFQDFLVLQNDLRAAQSSYENVRSMEKITDTVFSMGAVAGAEAYKLHIRSRNRKLALVGMLLVGGAYLYNKNKKVDDDVLPSRKNGYVDYSRRPKKQSNRGYVDYDRLSKKKSNRGSEEVKSYEK